MQIMKSVIASFAATLLAFAVTGCGETAVERAQRHLKRIEHMGSKDEICQAHRELAKAYLDEGSQLDYDSAKVGADIYCQAADIERLTG